MRSNKWFKLALIVLLLLLVSDDKLHINTIKKQTSFVMNQIELKWREIQNPDLEGLEGPAVLMMDQKSGKILYGDAQLGSMD